MTTYYVKTGGNDEASGLSDELAWATLAKVNASSFNAGDSILFNRGNTFTNPYDYGLIPPSNGSAGSVITFGAYGTGALPIIRGANYTITHASGDWTDYTATVANTWYKTQADPVRLQIDGTEYWPATAYTGVNSTNRWFAGTVAGTAGRLLVYSPGGNPATAGLVLTQAAGYRACRMPGKSYITLENLNLQGGTQAIKIVGDGASTPSSHITISGCTVGYMATDGLVIAGDDALTNTYITVTGCTFASGVTSAYAAAFGENHCQGDLLRIEGGDYCSIHDNTFTDSFHTAICLTNLYGALVRYNDIYNNTMTRVYIDYQRGMSVDGTLINKTCNNILHNNTILNMSVCNQINGNANTFNNNLINGMTRVATDPLGYAGGIAVQAYAGYQGGNTYAGNVIRHVEDYGILLDPDLDAGNTFTGNHIQFFGEDTEYPGTQGRSCAIDIIDDGGGPPGQTFTNNVIYHLTRTTDVISYRGNYVDAFHSVTEFNAHNGTDDDVITGNTQTAAGALLCPFRKPA